ncbi:MAG TPA: zf-HC2 domain-containing protein [Edaphobacter sp.]|nr:zf-HC2 domain-containing protein [Edaphobacter sp.]
MKHSELDIGVLRSYLDGELDAGIADAVGQHMETCGECQAELAVLRERAASVHTGMDQLPRLSGARDASAAATSWATFQTKRERVMEAEQSRWSLLKVSTLACVGFAVSLLVVLLVWAPARVWAQELLSVFRVQHFTVLELDPSVGNGLQNNQLVNQAVSRVLSDEVTVTQSPQKPQPVADAAMASQLAGFPVQLLSGHTPSTLLLEGGAGAEMKLDRDRLQSTLDEAGRGDLHVPESVDGAIISVHIPAGIMAFYGNCGDRANNEPQAAGEAKPQAADATCVSLMEVPSPSVSAPQGIHPDEIAQVALQFLGMSAKDAAGLTQTVDWTSTLVLPVVRGQSSYEQVRVNGNDGVLLRPQRGQPADRFTLMWVSDGIVYALNGTGDDTTALNLAAQLN